MKERAGLHVAFFNRSFYPDTTATGQLLTDLCEDLVRVHGCRVSVVTGPPLQPSAASRQDGRRPASRETYRGVEIHRVRGTRFDKRRFAGRATNYVSYFLTACWEGLSLDRPDVVVALTDPPIIGIAAWLAGKRFSAPLVMSYQDLFPEVASLLEDFHSETVNAALQAVNRFLCRSATRVVALGETMRSRLVDDKGAPPDRTVIITNWADTAALAPGPKRNAFSEAHGLADKFVVMHSGNMGLSQNLETIVEAAALLRDLPDVVVVFQGEGVKKAELEQSAREKGLENVRFLPYAPQEALGNSFAAADIFVISLQRGLAGYIVPSKLYGVLAAGKPYVAAVEDTCEVAAITGRYACGLVADPGNAGSLADHVRTFYGDRDLVVRAGANARAAGLVFDRQAQVALYMNLFQDILRNAPLHTPRLPATSESPGGDSVAVRADVPADRRL